MNSWLSPRILIAFAFAFIGAVFAGQMGGPAERIPVVFVSMLIALFVAAIPDDHDDVSSDVLNASADNTQQMRQ